jgi:hypothetical protein
MWALGGSIGGSVPSDPSLGNGLELVGNVETYVTPRVSIRGQLGGGWSDIVGRGFTGTINPVFVDGNVVYNWEGGVWHPFVTGGVGIYHYRSLLDGAGNGRIPGRVWISVAGWNTFTAAAGRSPSKRCITP